MLDQAQLNRIEDPQTRSLVQLLANLYEQVHADNQTLRAEVTRLIEDTHEPTAELGKRRSKPATLQARDHASEEQRGRTKRSVQNDNGDTIVVDRTVTVMGYDTETLPADAKCSGEERVVVQNLTLATDNTCFNRSRYFSPSTGKTYLASLPPGSEGGFGHDLKALVVGLHHRGDVSQPALLSLLTQLGIRISDAQLWDLLRTTPSAIEQEEQAIQAEVAMAMRHRIADASSQGEGADARLASVGEVSYYRYATTHETVSA